jgi:hypothetical protein
MRLMDDELFLFFKKPSFIIYSLVILTSLLSIFNKFERIKGGHSNEKGKTSRATTPTWIMRSSKTFNGVVVSILNLFIMRILGENCLLQIV